MPLPVMWFFSIIFPVRCRCALAESRLWAVANPDGATEIYIACLSTCQKKPFPCLLFQAASWNNYRSLFSMPVSLKQGNKTYQS